MRAVHWLALVALAAPAAARVDPGAPGRFTADHTTVVVIDPGRARTLVTDVWVPAVPSDRRFPLVLVAHGNCGSRTNYDFLTVHLASHGFIVAAPDFPGLTRDDCASGAPRGDFATGPPLDLRFLHEALRDAALAPTIARHIRGRRTGLAGHSLGGLAVLDAALLDARFRAVVALAPAASASLGVELAMKRPRRAVLAMGGTADTTLPFPVTVHLFEALAPPGFLIGITGGTHSGFTDVEPRLTEAALGRQHDIVRRYAMAFFFRYLAGARRFDRFLTAHDAEGLGQDVTLSVARRRSGLRAR